MTESNQLNAVEFQEILGSRTWNDKILFDPIFRAEYENWLDELNRRDEMREIKFKKRVKHTKIWCPFGSKKDIEGRRFLMDNHHSIKVTNEYGAYNTNVDERDILKEFRTTKESWPSFDQG